MSRYLNSVFLRFRSNLLRPLTTHDPEGMWNLLSIVRELFRHRDPNAIELLQLLTQECLSFDQIVVWWFNSRSQSSGRGQQFNKRENNNYKSYINTASTEMTKHACASFCDELVVLWRLACLYPVLSTAERQSLKERLDQWHSKTIEKAKNGKLPSCNSILFYFILCLVCLFLLPIYLMCLCVELPEFWGLCGLVRNFPLNLVSYVMYNHHWSYLWFRLHPLAFCFRYLIIYNSLKQISCYFGAIG